jgi:hypothetical protein
MPWETRCNTDQKQKGRCTECKFDKVSAYKREAIRPVGSSAVFSQIRTFADLNLPLSTLGTYLQEIGRG